MEKLAINVKEAAQMLGIGVSAMYDLAHRADFPTIQIGNRIVIPLEAFKRWVSSAGKNPYEIGGGRS